MADRLRAAGGLVLALALVVFAAAGEGRADEAQSIRLGMTAGFSGATREMAVELYRGAMAMFEGQNRIGGVAGRPVELLAEDDGYEPDRAIEASMRLLEHDGVLALFSSLGTPTISRLLPVLRLHDAGAARLFFPVTGLTAARRPPYVRYVYNLRASYRQEIEALIAAFARQGRTRVAICHQADAFGRSAWDGASQALARRGRSLCGEATFSRLTTAAADMTAQVRFLAEARPEAVLVIGPAPACAAVIRDMRRVGLSMPVGVVSFAGGELLLRELAAQGRHLELDLSQNLLLSEVTPSWRDPDLPAARDYRRDLARLGRGRPPPGGWIDGLPEGCFVGFEGYLNARAMLAVLGAMPAAPDREALDTAVAAANGCDIGLSAPLVFSGPRHQALDTVYLYTASGGRLVPLAGPAPGDGD